MWGERRGEKDVCDFLKRWVRGVGVRVLDSFRGCAGLRSLMELFAPVAQTPLGDRLSQQAFLHD